MSGRHRPPRRTLFPHTCPLCRQRVAALWSACEGVPLDPPRCSSCVRWTRPDAQQVKR